MLALAYLIFILALFSRIGSQFSFEETMYPDKKGHFQPPLLLVGIQFSPVQRPTEDFLGKQDNHLFCLGKQCIQPQVCAVSLTRS